MTDPDLQRLADLWTEPDSAEQEAFEAIARKARRRGRLFAYVDIATVTMILVGSVLGFVIRPTAVTMTCAVGLVVATVIVSWKRRQIRQMERTLSTASRQAFIETSISNATANLRRTTLSLAFFPFGVLFALLYKIAMRNGGRLEHPLPALSQWAHSTRGMIAMTILALIVAWSIRSALRIKRELLRLEELRSAYAEEARHEDRDAG
jgi:Na+/phosphate symporter